MKAKLFFSVVAMLSLVSCTEDIDIELKDEVSPVEKVVFSAFMENYAESRTGISDYPIDCSTLIHLVRSVLELKLLCTYLPWSYFIRAGESQHRAEFFIQDACAYPIVPHADYNLIHTLELLFDPEESEDILKRPWGYGDLCDIPFL